MGYKYKEFPNKRGSIEPSPEMPFFGQDFKTVEKWVIDNSPQIGDCMVCVTSYGGILTYKLAEVSGIDLGRFHCLSFSNVRAWHGVPTWSEKKLDFIDHGSWFYRKGKNVDEPKGQMRILAPTENLMQLFINNQVNELSVSGKFYRI